MRNKELIKNVPSSEQVLEWNAKETVAGAEQKANAALEQAKLYADENKVAKEIGKQLSTEDFTTEEKNKLATLNNYVHPEKHTTTDITTNADARFVSDLQVLDWDSKETVDGAQGKADKALADARAYTDQEIKRIDDIKIDHVELQNKELLFKAKELEKFRITLPNSLDKLPIASNTVLGGVKIGAGLTVNADGMLSATGNGVADSIMWDNIIGKPDRFTPMEHIHESATTSLDGFMSKADKVKLDGLENYVHPISHPATIIAEDATHKFVTEEQIVSFNDKYTKVESNNLLKRKLDNVELAGNTLRFYADSIKKFNIELPVADFNTMLNKPDSFNPPVASSSSLGGIKVGSGLSILQDGTLSVDSTINTVDWSKIENKPTEFNPCIASKTKLGGVKAGAGIDISIDGTISIASNVSHYHTNITALNKITDSKINDWDSKETIDGSETRARRALEAAKRYTDQKMFKTKQITVNIFNYDNASKLYKSTVKHDLNCSSVIISAFDSTTKENILLSYKAVDLNTIEIGMVKQVDSIDLLIIGGEFMTAIERPVVNDAAIALDTTWSSQKIDTELKKYSSLEGQVRSVSDKVDGVDLTVKEQTNNISQVSNKVNALEIKDTENTRTFSLLRNDVNAKVAKAELSTPGGCEIDGTNIKANTLSVDLIKSNNENPIIRLFDQCAIDATAKMNQGKGDSIRLKWSDNDYIRISQNSTEFYNNGVCSMSIGNNTRPFISLFGKASIDATASMNHGVGDAVRLKWDDNNYMRVSAESISFYGNGKITMSLGTELSPTITLFGGKGSIDTDADSIRYRYDKDNYLRITNGEARFCLGGQTSVKITNAGITQGVPVTAINEVPRTLASGQQTSFSEFVANEFVNAVGVNENGKLTFDTTKITTPEMRNLLLEEDGSYSYSGCLALLTLALKEEINARKALEKNTTV